MPIYPRGIEEFKERKELYMMQDWLMQEDRRIRTGDILA